MEITPMARRQGLSRFAYCVLFLAAVSLLWGFALINEALHPSHGKAPQQPPLPVPALSSVVSSPKPRKSPIHMPVPDYRYSAGLSAEPPAWSGMTPVSAGVLSDNDTATYVEGGSGDADICQTGAQMDLVVVADLGAGAQVTDVTAVFTHQIDGYWKSWYSVDGSTWVEVEESGDNAFGVWQFHNWNLPAPIVTCRYIAFGVISCGGWSRISDLLITYTPGGGGGTPPDAPTITSTAGQVEECGAVGILVSGT